MSDPRDGMGEGETGHDAPRAGEFDVAVIGMSGRFPGADDVDEFWRNLRDGVDGITRFTADQLRAAGVPDEVLANPDFVRASGKLRDVEHFDAGFFGYSPREAEILEPSHRLFLECAWEALENAGYAPEHVRGRVGVYAGAGAPHYVETHVRANPELMARVGAFQANLASGKDFIATRTAYKLDLRGPALTVQTACSTSLVALHLAAQSLLSGECDLALAGGATVIVPQDSGYLYSHGSISSPDGRCRAFDARSAGTLSGSGVGVVVLKRLADALDDGDPVRAVIKGSAINNDGSAKVAFTAPGVEGQSSAISEALAAADVDPSSVTYVETHGSGTDLGDTIEIAALTRAYRQATDDVGFCALGAVKTSVGHLDTAAGITGFIKTVLALENRQIPPTLHFQSPNPKLGLETSPFFVCDRLREWKPAAGHPRRAGVSSFGIGGTNAHLIVEEAPPATPSGPSRPWQLLAVSARSPQSLDVATERLARHLGAHPEHPLADVAFTLREGRRAFAHRRVLVVREGEGAAELLSARAPDRVLSGTAEGGARSVAFLFAGLGDQYPDMARGLYEAEPAFRAEVDRCAELLRPHLGMDVREALFPGAPPSDAAQAGSVDLKAMLGRSAAPGPAAELLNRTELAQPAVFVIAYALARLWTSWGIVPDAVIGHSLGEYAAACVAGVLELDDALGLVADRARLIQQLPAGAMLAVSLDEAALRPFLAPGVSIAAVNAPGLAVAAGPEDAISAVEKALSAAGHLARRLPATHAFHSPMMRPAAAALAGRVARVALRPPRIPMISNVTGTWITDAQATDPGYWTRHLLGTVRFAEGVAELLKEPGRVLLEVGPGQTLSTFVRQRPAGEGEPAPLAVVPSLRYGYDRRPDPQFLLEALGRLWLAGVEVDWAAFRQGERRRRLPLPTYPWERQRYWVEAPNRDRFMEPAIDGGKRKNASEWTYVPTWTRTLAPAAPAHGHAHLLLLSDGRGLAERIGSALDRVGYNVLAVRPDTGFSAGKRLYTVRPGVRDDFRQMAETLRMVEMVPARVVHALSLSESQASLPSLCLLAEAVASFGQPAELIVLAAGAQEVTGGEDLSPAAASLVGAIRAIAREYPHLACRLVDVAPGDAGQELAARLAAEVVSGADDPVAAHRGRHRWVRGFRAARPSAAAAKIREGGAYLLVGGPESRTAGLARAIGETAGVRVAHVVPAGSTPAGGAELTRTADFADADSLAAAIREAEQRFGAIDGVAYAPDLPGAGELAAASEACAAWADGMAEIEAGLRAFQSALGERKPGFVLLESSLAGVLGGIGRVRAAAAGTLADAFAVRAGWTSVAWDRAADSAGEVGLAAEEVRPALDQVLALAGEAQVIVSTGGLDARIREASAPAPGQPAAALYARPELASEYHAPGNEVEQALAELWQGLLGIERVGVHDDFFGMGGHSLLATQIVARVRDMFQLELPLQSIFEAPTIARFAELVEAAIIAELEELSEDEASALTA